MGLDVYGGVLALHHLNVKFDMSDNQPHSFFGKSPRLRLSDYPPPWSAAVQSGRPVIPVFITRIPRSTPLALRRKWRLRAWGLGALAEQSGEIIRQACAGAKADALDVLQTLIKGKARVLSIGSRLY